MSRQLAGHSRRAAVLASAADASIAQNDQHEVGPGEHMVLLRSLLRGEPDDEDGSHPERQVGGSRYRTFAFAKGKSEVREPWLACINEVMRLWGPYQSSAPPLGANAGADAARDRVSGAPRASQGPQARGAASKKTAPRSRISSSSPISPTSSCSSAWRSRRRASPNTRGRFAEKEALDHDILLVAATEGVKPYVPEPRLVFGGPRPGDAAALVGQAPIRNVGWVAPMGEYAIDIRFGFSVAEEDNALGKQRPVEVSTWT